MAAVHRYFLNFEVCVLILDSYAFGHTGLLSSYRIQYHSSLEDEGVNQMKMLYSSCPPEMRDTLLHHTQETVKELTELSEKFETN